MKVYEAKGDKKFLSTLPVRGATRYSCLSAFKRLVISIHAPREGSDLKKRVAQLEAS